MGQGTRHHTGTTPLTFLQIDKKKTFGVWYGVRNGKQLAWQHEVCADCGREA
jgi:hypothetical protein